MTLRPSAFVTRFSLLYTAFALLCAPFATAEMTAPVTHSPAGDDSSFGICWAYTMTGLMEGEAMKHGQNVSLSAEYLGFYHLLAEVKRDLPLYEGLSKASAATLQPMVDQYVKWFLDPSFGARDGLSDLSKYGIVPRSLVTYDGDIDINSSLLDFAQNNLIDPKMNAQYRSNTDALAADLMVAVGIRAPHPTDTFTYAGNQYTAMTFMSSYLGFKTSNYETIKADPLYIQKDLQLIERVLKDNIAVPIAFDITSNQDAIESSGIFTTAGCPMGICTSLPGGHMVLAISAETGNNGDVSALLIKNDWGAEGFDQYGQVNDDPTQTGFFFLMSNYLGQALDRAAWSYIIPKTYLNSASALTHLDL